MVESTFTRRRVAIGLYVLVTVACLVTAAPERYRTHTAANHFALLADAWLHGHLDLGGPPPAYTGNNDFALYDGKHFISFPPFPALLLVPFVKLAGGADHLPDGLVFLFFAGVAPSFLFLALEKLADLERTRRTRFENAALAALFALGSVYWFSAIQGTVWFAAHVVGAALASIYLYASIGATHPLVAGLCLGLGFATRTPLGFAFPLFLCEAWRASQGQGSASSNARVNTANDRSTDSVDDASTRGTPASDRAAAPSLDVRVFLERSAIFAAPAAVILGLLVWHNQARFGDPFEFGHRYLTVVWRARIEKWGLFSYHYVPRNLAVVLTSLPFTHTAGAPFQINAHGLALWFTTPLYAWALWPRRTSATFWALALTAAAVALPSLAYQNSGWVQFGYRFSNDFAPFLFAMIAASARRFTFPFWLLAAWSVAVNAFGAVTFDRPAAACYYFVDGSQRILHQPD
ncbi:MAG: hypothetical protein U0441_25775 [Polyangiaceae bacterium]